jgi:hypothetical protein
MRLPRFVAKGTIIVLAGLAIGYYMGLDTAHDSARGRALTMKQYIADFEHHKAHLESAAIPMIPSLLIGVLMTTFTFGVYELLGAGLAKGIRALDRRTIGPTDDLESS